MSFFHNPNRNYRWTLLGHSVRMGNLDKVRFLLLLPEIDLRLGGYRMGRKIRTPLDIAVQQDNEEMALCLTLEGAPFSIPIPDVMSGKMVSALVASWSEGKVTEADVRTVLGAIGLGDEEMAEFLEKEFHNGSIKLGFPTANHWKPFCDAIREVETKFQHCNDSVAELQTKIDLGIARTAEIDNQIKALQEERVSHQQQIFSHKRLKRTLETKQEFCDNKIGPIKKAAEIFDNTESKLLNQVKEISEDATKLVALDEEGGPKLSLLFNAVGIEAKYIRELASVSAFEFVHSIGENWGFIDDIRVRKDLAYLQQFLHSASILSFESHQEKCVVCGCLDFNDLEGLLQEHELELPGSMEEFLRQHNFNGRRFVSLTVSDCKDIAKGKESECMKVVLYLKRMHFSEITQ